MSMQDLDYDRRGLRRKRQVARHPQIDSVPSMLLFDNRTVLQDPAVFKGNWSGNLQEDDLGRWLQMQSRPLLQTYDYKIRDPLEKLGLAPVHIFTAPDDKNTAVYKAVAAKFRNKLAFVMLGTDNSYHMEDFNMNSASLPAVGVTASFAHGIPHYTMTEAVSEAALEQFCEDYLAGKLKPVVKSEAAPPVGDWQPGKVMKVVGKTIPEVVAGEKPILISMYKPWFEAKAAVEKTHSEVAQMLKDVAIAVGRFDTSLNGLDTEGPFQKHVDMITDDPLRKGAHHFLVPGNGKAVLKYNGEFTESAILSFLKGKVPGVAKEWSKIEGILKSKQILEEQKKKAEEEKLKNAQKVIIPGTNEGIIKHIFEEGKGNSPQPGDKVKAHYTGTLLNGEKFDSSRDRNSPFDFTLGQAQVIKCWDQGFATMKKGEKALLTCTAPYAYGERGSPPKIPGGATLKFDVELIDFTSKKEL